MQRKTLFGAALAASLMILGPAVHAASYNPRGDIDHDGIQNRYDRDRDGDGILNRSDPNPNIYNRTRIARHARDTDHDGIADRSDRDIDGDRVPNRRDRFPYNPRRA